MQRANTGQACRALVLAWAAVVAHGCSSASVTNAAGSGCGAGEVDIGGACAQLCSNNLDCADNEVCNLTTQLCDVVSSTNANEVPRIAGVNGLGSADGAEGRAANFIGTGLSIAGTGLGNTLADFAIVLLDAAGAIIDLTGLVVSSGGDGLVVTLPTTVVAGTYTLRISNHAGVDQRTLTLERGTPGAAGAAGSAGTCTAGCALALPGVTNSVFITAQAVNPLLASKLSRVEVTKDGGAVLANFTPPTIGNGFIGIFLSRTPAEDGSGHTLSPAVTPAQTVYTTFDSLKAVIDSLTPDTLAIIASVGDVSEGGLTGDRAALSAALMTLGAPPAVNAIQATDAFVLMGHIGMGAGHALFTRVDATVNRDLNGDTVADGRTAEAAAMLLGNQLLGVQAANLGHLASMAIVGGNVTLDDGVGAGQTVTLSESSGVLAVDRPTNIMGTLTIGTLGGVGGSLLHATDGVMGTATLGAGLSSGGPGMLDVNGAQSFNNLTFDGGVSGPVAVTGTVANLLEADKLVQTAGLTVAGSATLPATCTAGDLYFDTDAGGATGKGIFYGCSETDTWAALSGRRQILVANERYDRAPDRAGWDVTTPNNCVTGGVLSNCVAGGTLSNTTCGTGQVLGGYTELGGETVARDTPSAFAGGLCIGKTFANLPAHTALRFTVDLYYIDSWDVSPATEGAWIKLDGSTDVLYFENAPPPQAHLCGGGTWFDRIQPLDITTPHTGSSALLEFCYYLTSASNDESFGFGDLTLWVLE